MSIASQITTMQEHIEDIYDTFAVAGVDTSAAAKNIVNINANLKERLEYYLANGLDVVWNNWNKVSESGTTLSLNNTIQAKMDFVYKGNTSQSILPSGYTQVDYITSDGNSYIDTGKTLGDNFKIETKFIHNQRSSNEQPIISTWVNSYAWFNLYIASNNQLRFYAAGNHMTANPTLTIGNINTVSYSRNDNEWVGTLNGEEVTFTTELTSSNLTTFKILARGDGTRGSYVSIYRLKLFENNILTMDLIPCYRNSDNVIGMYDIVNNQFLTNAGTGTFTYGSIAPNPECPIPVNVVTGDNEVKVEGKNLAYTGWAENFVTRINNSSKANIITFDGKNCLFYKSDAGYEDYDNKYLFKRNWKENTQYTISFKYYGGFYSNSQIVYTDDTKTEITTVSGTDWHNVTITSDANKTIKYISPRWRSNETYIDLDTFMVYEGTDNADYVPYQSQTYPINLGSIELCKIGDYQDYIAKSTGKNLFDANNYNLITVYFDENILIGESANKSIYIPCEKNTTYTISKMPSKRFGVAYTTEIPANNVSIYGKIFNHDGNSITITTGNDAVYLIVWLLNGNMAGEITLEQAINTLQIELGSSATTYEPYGIGWYKYSAIGKVVLDGSENWNRSINNNIARFELNNIDYKKGGDFHINLMPLFSNYFSLYDFTNVYDGTKTGCAYWWSSSTKILLFGFQDDRTLETFKTWLSTHNTDVYYVLATPTITEITDTALINQLEAIKLSYNEQTNISQTNADKPFILDVTALKDLDAEDTTPTLAINRGLSFTQPPVSENSINDENDNSMLEETINEEEPNIEDDNREEEKPVDFFEEEIINNNEDQEEIPTELIEIDNGQK